MAQAQQRALQALNQSANMASQTRGQDFEVNNTRAKALDERNKFLYQNSIDRQRQNVNRLNSAQQANLAEQQRIQDANTRMSNAEKLRQVQEQGNYWNNKLDYAQTKANVQMRQASAARQNAQDTVRMFSNIGQGLGKLGSAAYQSGAFSSPTPDAAGGTTDYSTEYLSGANDKYLTKE